MRTILAIPADTHCGSDTGLVPEGWTGIEGGSYTPSESQKVIRGQWKECWHRIRELNNKKTRLVIISNGDPIEGVHHGTTQILTNNKQEQKRMHIACMLEAMKIAKWNDDTDVLYYMQGTFSHNGTMEDEIARDFISKKGKQLVPAVIEPTAAGQYKDGRYIREHMQLDINGVLFDIGHAGLSAGSRAWTKNNTVNATAKSIYLTSLENSTRRPRYAVASHKHEYVKGSYEGKHGKIECFISPSFQLKTHFGHAVARWKMADIGMLFFIVEDNGDSRHECLMAEHPDVEVEVL